MGSCLSSRSNQGLDLAGAPSQDTSSLEAWPGALWSRQWVFKLVLSLHPWASLGYSSTQSPQQPGPPQSWYQDPRPSTFSSGGSKAPLCCLLLSGSLISGEDLGPHVWHLSIWLSQGSTRGTFTPRPPPPHKRTVRTRPTKQGAEDPALARVVHQLLAKCMSLIFNFFFEISLSV